MSSSNHQFNTLFHPLNIDNLPSQWEQLVYLIFDALCHLKDAYNIFDFQSQASPRAIFLEAASAAVEGTLDYNNVRAAKYKLKKLVKSHIPASKIQFI